MSSDTVTWRVGEENSDASIFEGTELGRLGRIALFGSVLSLRHWDVRKKNPSCATASESGAREAGDWARLSEGGRETT